MSSLKGIFNSPAVPVLKRVSSTRRSPPFATNKSPTRPRNRINKIYPKEADNNSVHKPAAGIKSGKVKSVLPLAHAPDGAEFHRKRQSFVQCRNQSSQTEIELASSITDNQANNLELQLENKLSLNEEEIETNRSTQTDAAQKPTNYRTKKKPIRYMKSTKEPEQIDPDCPPGHIAMSEDERLKMLSQLQTSYDLNLKELNKLPICVDTLRVRTIRVALEKQLQQIEANVKIFSKPKVYIKIDNVT